MAADAQDQRLTFEGGSGHELAGVLRRPEGEPRGAIVLSHCFTCSKDLHTMTRLASALASAGWAVLRFDFTGIGESEGDFADKTITRNVEDVVRAAAAVREHVDGPLGLVGHSLGGAATLLAAPRIDDVGSVAVINTPSSPLHLRDVLSEIVDEVESEGVVTARLAGRDFPVSAGLLADLERHDQEGRVAELGCPLLVVHALGDTTVRVGEGASTFAAARQPKAFVPLLSGGHLLTDRGAAARCALVLTDWFNVTT